MKKDLITTITGEDAPYIIRALAETTRSLGGEWTRSKVIHLHGRFAALMKVSVDPEQERELNRKLKDLYPGLHFEYTPLPEVDPEGMETITVVIDCEDRPGLTHDIIGVLSDLNLESEGLESHRLPVAPVGGTVYSAKLSVRVPDALTKTELVRSLEDIASCSRVMVD